MSFLKKVWNAGRAGGTPYTSGDNNRWETGLAEAHTVLDAFAETLQEGVVKSGDGLVAFTDATHVRVPAGVAYIDGDGVAGRDGALNGRYRVTWPQTDLLVPVPATGMARLDQIAVPVPASGHGVSAPTRVAGAESGAVGLANRTGAVDISAQGMVRLADLNPSQGNGGLRAIDVRDRRPWCRGVNHTYVDTSGSFANATTSINAIGTAQRYEFSGVPVELTYDFTSECSQAGGRGRLDARIDTNSVAIGSSSGSGVSDYARLLWPNASIAHRQTQRFKLTPTPGSHQIQMYCGLDTGAGSITIYGQATIPRLMTITELVQQDVAQT